MTVTDFDPRHQQTSKSADRKPLSLALLIAVLSILAVDGLVMAAPSVWTAARSAFGAQQSRLFECATTDAEHERLACYDRIGNETLQPPARGANAPLGLGVKDVFTR
jgi:hypothetical protein